VEGSGMSGQRMCKGPRCSKLIDTGGNGRRLYCGEQCKDRAYRERVKAAAAAAGVPVKASLRFFGTPSAPGSTGEGRADAQNKRKAAKRRPPSLRISYPKAVEALTAALTNAGGHLIGMPEPRARECAEQILRPHLSPKVREHLERAA
jgi:hypothetical protein